MKLIAEFFHNPVYDVARTFLHRGLMVACTTAIAGLAFFFEAYPLHSDTAVTYILSRNIAGISLTLGLMSIVGSFILAVNFRVKSKQK